MIQSNNRMVYYQTNTRNKSFIDMAIFLERYGIKNNKFHLVLFDPDLYNIDPHDPNLNIFMQKKIWQECMVNYWYFIREAVRIPDQGSVNGGIHYQLHRGNLALNFCLIRNMNIFEELPRQFGKTIGVCVRLLWEFLFGTTNSEMALLNKKHDDSKLNLQRIRAMRELLPSYLQMRNNYGTNGVKLKDKDGGAEKLINDVNNNSIKTLPAARNKIAADSLGRGCTQPRQWYDEYAFIPFNKEIFLSATPAFTKASQNAMRNNAPYGIIITTTPGDLTTDSGMEAFQTKEIATTFSEQWYDLTDQELIDLLSKNTSTNFVYIKFTYKQLGAGEDYLARMIKEMKKEWAAIRREVLLEWTEASDNSPFRKEDIDIIKTHIKEPINVIKLCKYYELNLYKPLYSDVYPPIIGVDVSGGLNRDSSAITIIDSQTTEVAAELNNNYISPKELAYCIIELVMLHMPTAVVNVERNGGFGLAVLKELIDSPIKHNLYYEDKEKILEERYDGIQTHKVKKKVRVYGLDSTKNVRDELMEILRQRVENHKDKFVSPIIYKELQTLEVKKSGKIEHSANGHDDQLLSYLVGLYVWYNGKDLMNRWGIRKTTLKSDMDVTIENISMEEKYKDIVLTDVITVEDTDNEDIVQQQMNYIKQSNVYTPEEWGYKQYLEDEQAYLNLLATPIGQKAHKEKYNLSDSDMEVIKNKYVPTVPTEVFNSFYDDVIQPVSDNVESNDVNPYNLLN